MRLPELLGYRYEQLIEEDPFGWSFAASHESGEWRLLRVLKAQATSDALVYQLLRPFFDADFRLGGVAEIHDLAFQDDYTPAVMGMPLLGWQGRDSKQWQLTSLRQLQGLLSREQAVDVVEKLAHSLDIVHRAGSFHGGLRPGNVFVTSDGAGDQQVRIAGFGEAFVAGAQYLEAGDILFYASPEQLASGDYSNGAGRGWDVYAFGVIAHQLLTGQLPRLDPLYRQCTETESVMEGVPAICYGRLTEASEHFQRQLAKEREFAGWLDDPSSPREALLRPVISSCLAYDAPARPSSMADVISALKTATREAERASRAASSLVEEAAPVEMAPAAENESPGRRRRSRRGVTLPSLANFPKFNLPAWSARVFSGGGNTIWWQISTGVAVALMSLFAVHSVVNGYRARELERRLDVKVEEWQSNVEQQAESYRRALNERQSRSQNLEAELDEAKDSRSRLVGEAKLARQIIRQAQSHGDAFFRLILDNRDTDVPGFRVDRAKAMAEGRKHYERLIEVYGNAPDFIESTADAMFYLGEIYKETGEFGRALASFGEAERRYLAILDGADRPNPRYFAHLARAKQSLGVLAMSNGRYANARAFLGESSQYWSEYRRLEPGDAMIAGLHIHENSLAIVECERAVGNFEAALDAARSIGAQLLELQMQDPENHRVVGALAKSFALSGLILENRGEGEFAIEAYQQAGNLFGKAVRLNAAVDDYHLGLGNSLAKVGLLENDLDKLKGAVEVLAEVIPDNPFKPDFQRTLADVFGALAKNQRDGGHFDRAIALEQRAVALLGPVVRNNTNAPADVLHSYAQRLSHLAELQGDAGNFDESRQPLEEAIGVLSRIANAEYAKPSYRSTLARAQGLAGFACLQSGDEIRAKEHYELAQAEWEAYMAAKPEDPEAARAAQWTRDQLRRLQ